MKLLRYKKKDNLIVSAVQLDLDTDGFIYNKWGAQQKCNPGDWVVNNNGNCYTINKETFAETYAMAALGQYVKVAPVWAEPATTSGKVKTTEGSTDYEAGDYLVYNNADGSDGYAMSEEEFLRMYVQDEEESQ